MPPDQGPVCLTYCASACGPLPPWNAVAKGVTGLTASFRGGGDQMELPLSAQGDGVNQGIADFYLLAPDDVPEGGLSYEVTLDVDSRTGAETQVNSFTAEVLDKDSVVLLESDDADVSGRIGVLMK